MTRQRPAFAVGLACLLVLAASGAARGAITDLTTWTEIQDPPNPSFTASTTSSQATLLAGNGAIPSGTDIGYKSVNGLTPALSTAGHAFDPSSSFSVAVDFNLTFANAPSGALAIGFGIGEDGDGANSAGAVMFTSNGSPSLFFGAAARVNDVNQPGGLIPVAASPSGTLFASYDATSGDVRLGATPAPGAAAPTGTAVYPAIQNLWAGGDLLASFFLRSDATLGPAWQGGNGQAVFSNFRVLSGSPTAIVPEPSGLAVSRRYSCLLAADPWWPRRKSRPLSVTMAWPLCLCRRYLGR
jgi:hypothetical protein